MSSDQVTVIKVDTPVNSAPQVATEPLAPIAGGMWPFSKKEDVAPPSSLLDESDDSDIDLTEDEEDQVTPPPPAIGSQQESFGAEKDEDEHEDDDALLGKSPRNTFVGGGSDDEEDKASLASSIKTVDLLAEDPLFLVLGQFFVSKKKENLVDVMDKLNENLEKLMKLMSDK